MTAFTLRAKWVLPIEGPPIDDGYLSVVDGRIIAVGRWRADAARADAARADDLGDVVLLPGFVNAHTHLEFSDLKQPLGSAGMSLPAWIRLVIGERKRGDRNVSAAIAAGLSESLAAGVTTIGEIATAPAVFYAAPASPAVLLFQEAIGFSAGRVDSVYADVTQRLDAARLPAGLSPHAPYTVHPRLIERMVALACDRDAPVAMHLAESREELQLLAEGDGEFRQLLVERSMWDKEAIPRGSKALDYLRTLSHAPRALVIHGNYLSAEEIGFLAARSQRMSVVYCPRTHAYFQHDPFPLAAMMNAGVRVVFGTDSRASNPDLSVLDELRFAASLYSRIAPEALLRMATLDAAEALGLQHDVGSLAIGKRADLVAIPLTTNRDPYGAVIDSKQSPSRVWLGGDEVTGVLDLSRSTRISPLF